MYDNYKDIFKVRGIQYDNAMKKYPNARNEEFETLIHNLKIEHHQKLCDIPAGGSYLEKFLDKSIDVYAIENCFEFIVNSNKTNQGNILVSDLTNIAVESNTFDHVISLAGIHHLKNKKQFFNEIHRILKPGGQFCIADVHQDSNVSIFLDEIVDKYNSQGHKGDYLNDSSLDDIKDCGLNVNHVVRKKINWALENTEQIIDFCTLLFGLDKVDKVQLLSEIKNTIGIEEHNNRACLNWELYYITGNKNNHL